VRDMLASVGVPEGKPQLLGNRMSILMTPSAGKPAPAQKDAAVPAQPQKQ